jgi:MFS family permease
MFAEVDRLEGGALAQTDAPDRADPVRTRFLSSLIRPILVLLLLQLMGGLILSPQRTFFPIYIHELGYPVLLISILAMGQQAMGLLGAWVGGALSDRLGRKTTLMLGQVGAFLASLAFLTPWPGLIAPLWIISGFCGGVNTVGAQSYLMDAAHPGYLGVLTALYNWGTTLGGALGSPVAGALLDRWSYAAFGLALSAVALLALGVNGLVLPRATGKTHRGPSHQALMGYGDLAKRPVCLLLAFLRFLPTFYWGMALILIPLLLLATGASKTAIALYATISQVCACAGQIVAGRAADRYGAKWVTVTAFVLLVTSMLGTAIASGHFVGIFVCGTLGTTAAWSLSTLMPSLVARVTQSHERGRVLGWVHLWWNLGMILGSLAGGALYRWGAGWPFLLAALLNLVAICLVFVFFRIAEKAT